MPRTVISVKTLISTCKLKVNFTHFSLEKVIENLSSKDPRTASLWLHVLQKRLWKKKFKPYFTILTRCIETVAHSIQVYRNHVLLGFKVAPIFLKRERGPRASSPVFTVEKPQIKKHFFPSNTVLMLASGMMDVHRQVGGSFVDQSRLSCFLPSLSTSG